MDENISVNRVRPTVTLDYEDYVAMQDTIKHANESILKYNIICEYIRLTKFSDEINAEVFLSQHNYKIELTNNRVKLIKTNKK